MLPLHSTKTQLPGSRRHDLFTKPDLESNEFVEEPTDPLKIPQVDLSPDQFVLLQKDLFLESSLNSIDKPTLTRDNGTITIETTAAIPQSLLSTIKLYPAQYTGRVSPTSTSSCQLVAGKLGDIYDPIKKRFLRRSFLENDYLGLIAREEEAGRTLIAFDRTYVLPAIAQYIAENGSYDTIRTQKLREQLQELNPAVSSTGEVYIRWQPAELAPGLPGSSPDLPPGQPFSISSLRIYSFYDSAIENLSQLYMIFAPVGVEEVERLLVYLNVNIKLYSYFANMAVESLPPEKGLDFRYLFPVRLSYIGSFTVISSNQLDGDVLESIYKFDWVPFVYSKIDELRGAFATYLMAEALFFEFPLRWEAGRFFVGMAGYIQAQDINQRFAQLLTELNLIQLKFTPVENFQAAIELARSTDVKCFYYHGRYYAVTSEKNVRKIPQELPSLDQLTISLIELKGPLQAVTETRTSEAAKQYLALMGYDTSPNPVPYENKIDLGYKTYQDGTRIFTIYYYTSTYKADRQIHEIDGPHDEQVRRGLERLLRRGYFSTQRFKNITRGYPNFVPSDQPIPRSLSRRVQSLLTELENLQA